MLNIIFSSYELQYKLSKVLNMWQENSFQIDGNYFKSLKDEDISKRYFKKLLEFDKEHCADNVFINLPIVLI